MAKNDGAKIKEDELYKEQRKRGESKEQAAPTATAKASGTLDHGGSQLGGQTKNDLYKGAGHRHRGC